MVKKISYSILEQTLVEIVDLFGCLIANIGIAAKDSGSVIAYWLTNWNGETVNNQELTA